MLLEMKTANVKVLLFGAFRDLSDENPIKLDLPESSTVKDLKTALCARFGAQYPTFDASTLVTHSAIAGDDAVLTDSDSVVSYRELAILPPVCGG